MGARRVGGEVATQTKRRRWGAVVGAVAVFVTVTALWVDRFYPFERWANQTLHPPASAPKPVVNIPDTGAINVVQPLPIGTDSSVSKVPLPLILTGTRLGRNSREGYADIGVNALSPQTYRAGAILANGARLEEIYADSVVLVRKEQRTRLYIVGHAPPADAQPVVASLMTVGGTAPVPAAVANSRDALVDAMRISPVYDGDTFRALELYPNAQSDAFARLGLEPGDRVTAIEGVALKDSRAAIAELRRLTSGASLNVTIERGGKSQTLSLNGSLVKPGGTRG